MVGRSNAFQTCHMKMLTCFLRDSIMTSSVRVFENGVTAKRIESDSLISNRLCIPLKSCWVQGQP